MTVVWGTEPPSTIATTDIFLIDYEEDNSRDIPGRAPNDERNVIEAVHDHPTIDKETEMERHYKV